jgi:hypothetical protein
MELIARLKGGLGNQLFIYASAYAFCRDFGYKLYIDSRTGFLRDRYKRVNKIDALIIDARYKNFHSLLYFVFKKFSPKLASFLYKNWHEIVEKDYKAFTVFNLPHPRPSRIVFDGLWQSAAYFSKYRNEILEQIIFQNQHEYQKNDLYDFIKRSVSVAVHVRRVDYSNCLDLGYYRRAMAFLDNKIRNPTYFVFSDDVEWCKINFSDAENVVFVDNVNDSDCEEFYLMLQCKHFIIANSSFSWWAAWLSNTDYKTVIASKTFKPHDKYYSDYWVQIE